MLHLTLCCSAALLVAIAAFPGVWGREPEESGVHVDTSKALFLRDRRDIATQKGIHKVGRDTVVDIISEKTSSSSSVLHAGGEGRRERRSGDDAVHSRSRRATSYSSSDAAAIVATHNDGRGRVTPEAANMKTMVSY